MTKTPISIPFHTEGDGCGSMTNTELLKHQGLDIVFKCHRYLGLAIQWQLALYFTCSPVELRLYRHDCDHFKHILIVWQKYIALSQYS